MKRTFKLFEVTFENFCDFLNQASSWSLKYPYILTNITAWMQIGNMDPSLLIQKFKNICKNGKLMPLFILNAFAILQEVLLICHDIILF